VRTEIDGLVVHTGEVRGPLRAALMFRAGHADETFVTHGLTHLVEHLALSGMTPADGSTVGSSRWRRCWSRAARTITCGGCCMRTRAA